MKRFAPLTIALLLMADPASAQIAFEVEAGGGYTLVDVEAVAANDGQFAQEWEQPSFRLAGRAFFGPAASTRFGAELAYQHLYWYSARIPYGTTPYTRDYAVTAMSALGLMRLGSGGTTVDLGAGLPMFDEPVGAVSVALGWTVAPGFAVKIRADGMLASEPTVPVGIAFSYGFGPS